MNGRMRRIYREKIYRCGDYLDVQVFPAFKKGGSRRKKKAKPTSEMQARLNQKNAELALTRILNANFNENDISVSLTYSEDNLPDNLDAAERDAKNFLRRVKRLRCKLGLDEIKYVCVLGDGRFHFHIPMNGGIDDKTLQRLWPKGYCNIIHFEFNENGIEGHAKYIARQFDTDEDLDIFSIFDINTETGEVTEKEGKTSYRRKGKRRYSCSKNIIRPKAEEKEGRLTAKKVEEMATVDSASISEFEKLYPGYCLSDCKPYYNEENGGYYLHIRLYRKDADFLKNWKKFNCRR